MSGGGGRFRGGEEEEEEEEEEEGGVSGVKEGKVFMISVAVLTYCTVLYGNVRSTKLTYTLTLSACLQGQLNRTPRAINP